MSLGKEEFGKIEILLDEIISLILSEHTTNPFEDLEKAKKIISQKNFKQLPLIIKKLNNFTMLFYNQRHINDEIIVGKLNEIYDILQ